MAIYRHNHEQEFTILPNSLIRNPELSLRDVGLLCYMLSLPPDWEFSIDGLDYVIQNNGASSVRAALKNLEKNGYLQRNWIRSEDGRILRNQWTVSDLPIAEQDTAPEDNKPYVENPHADNPHADNQHADNPHADNPHAENRRQTKNISNKVNNHKENKNKEKREQKALSLPDLQDIISYIQENGYQVDAEQFYDYYTARGWKVNGSPIADWTALVRNWARREPAEPVRQFGPVRKPAEPTHYWLSNVV